MGAPSAIGGGKAHGGGNRGPADEGPGVRKQLDTSVS